MRMTLICKFIMLMQLKWHGVELTEQTDLLNLIFSLKEQMPCFSIWSVFTLWPIDAADDLWWTCSSNDRRSFNYHWRLSNTVQGHSTLNAPLCSAESSRLSEAPARVSAWRRSQRIWKSFQRAGRHIVLSEHTPLQMQIQQCIHPFLILRDMLVRRLKIHLSATHTQNKTKWFW